MADSQCFAFVCAQLEKRTALDGLAARGTVRIALKQGGLEARTVTAQQMRVVLERVLPAELESRGVEDSEDLCSQLASGLDQMAPEDAAETPDAIFRRLAGGA